MTLLEAVTIVVAAQGYRGLGFKSAAALAGIPRSAMRYALQAWRVGITFAILAGTIKDQRVVGILNALPTAACKAVARVETKLNRKLDRRRAARIVELFNARSNNHVDHGFLRNLRLREGGSGLRV